MLAEGLLPLSPVRLPGEAGRSPALAAPHPSGFLWGHPYLSKRDPQHSAPPALSAVPFAESSIQR